MFRLRPQLAVAVVALGVILLTAAACGDSSNGGDEERTTALESRVTTMENTLMQLQDAVQREQVIGAVNALNNAGIHRLDEDLQKASTLDPALLSTIRRARQVAAATDWTEDLKDKAGTMVQAFQDLEAALASEDLAASKAASVAAHAAWHSLDQLAYAYISGGQAMDGAHH